MSTLHADALGGAEQASDESHALGWFTADDLPAPLADATARLIPLALQAFAW